MRKPAAVADASPGHDRAVPRLVRLRLGYPQGCRGSPFHSDEDHVPHSERGELVCAEEVPNSCDKQALPWGQGDGQLGWREDHRLSPTPGPRALVTLPLGQASSPRQTGVHLVVLLVSAQGRRTVQGCTLVLPEAQVGHRLAKDRRSEEPGPGVTLDHTRPLQVAQRGVPGTKPGPHGVKRASRVGFRGLHGHPVRQAAEVL